MMRRKPFNPTITERLIVYALFIPTALLFLVVAIHDRRHNSNDGELGRALKDLSPENRRRSDERMGLER